ncbi:uncharacterized protein EDB91DRAFT_1278842 [Suillus paluster]|uniref:uncharacterized protein n=1 Tax=Suillus paluster TaxID=48578 RepID=UPI001B86416B|nr:uncharacterized protein EDB91DRAFT_1278842 [Suillus paluster]KAG1721169.1 hypothetical protein EDB91DRAFT_1278842 [Suillus paluster]
MYGPAYITLNLSLNPTPVKVDQLVWSTCFRTHSAVADHTFTLLGAAIFLVSDAAHIHSPAGVQGMNLAIRDVIFFTEAITKHIQTLAGDSDVDDTILQECASWASAGNHQLHQEALGACKPYAQCVCVVDAVQSGLYPRSDVEDIGQI